MLTRLAPSLTEADHSDLAALGVDGWAAGVQMTALAARSSEARRSNGAIGPRRERCSLDDFVWHEVLAARAR